MTLSEWEGTPWAGSSIAVAEPPARLPSDRAEVAKAITGPFAGRVEFGTYLAPSAKTPQAMMIRAQQAYHRNPWVFAAEATVTRRVAGLPWHLEDEQDEEYEEPFPAPVKIAHDLLEKPQAALPPELRDPGLLTRRSLISIISRHMGLCGLSYVYLDQPDVNGIPLALLYVNPARVWPATTATGRIIGWVLDPADETGRGGTPLALNELLPFYLDPPDRGPYPAGLYERVILKAQITTLADQHAAYVLGTGGRIAGIVSPKEGTIQDEQFNVLVQEFRNVNEAPDSAKRTTVVRGPIDFTEMAATPNELHLIDLAKMNREDIFAVWGVPPSQAAIPAAAGLNSGDTKKYDEAVLMQGAVHDRVVAIRETLQYGLLDRWLATGTTIDLEIEEPEFDDRAPAFALAQAATNQPLKNVERRELMGLDPFGDERDDEVWLPVTTVLAFGGNEPQVTITAPPPPPLLPDGKGKREFLGLRKSVDRQWVPQVRRAVASVLAQQRADAVAKVRSASPDALARQRKNRRWAFDPDKAADQLRKALAPIAAAIAETVAERTRELVPTEAKADPFTDRLVQSLLAKIGQRIVGISETTRDAIADAISQGYDDGLSPTQIADSLDSLPAFDAARAEMVARTETMFAYNAAALGSYDEFGVSQVQAIDGDDDEECAARDGQTYSLDEAYAIEDHPNGTLDWIPVL